MHGFKSYFPSSLYTSTAASAVVAAKAGAAPAAGCFAPSMTFQHPAAGFMAASQQEYGLDYFLKGALAGGICCSVTHGALTPVDVVKTRIQLEPAKYTGMMQGFNKVIAEEGRRDQNGRRRNILVEKLKEYESLSLSPSLCR